MSQLRARSLPRMVVSVSFVLVLAAVLSAEEDNDWQCWTKFKLKVGVTDDVSVFAQPGVRYKDDFDTWF